MKKLNLSGVVASTVIGLTAIAVHAQTDPYASGTNGYDVSYPNSCTATVSGASFGIVGVNGGRPFTTNACFSTQFGHAPAGAAYINVAYSGAYRKNITSSCVSLVSTTSLTGSYAQAWEIGCSEADTSLSDAGSAAPVMWWLDVETANSWSSTNFKLNDDAIRGAADRLRGVTGKAVGVYSTPSAWYTITRNANLSPYLDGEWNAGASACPASGAIGFAGAPIWLEQTGSSGEIDADSAC